jgi:hypothetical protein
MTPATKTETKNVPLTPTASTPDTNTGKTGLGVDVEAAPQVVQAGTTTGTVCTGAVYTIVAEAEQVVVGTMTPGVVTPQSTVMVAGTQVRQPAGVGTTHSVACSQASQKG